MQRGMRIMELAKVLDMLSNRASIADAKIAAAELYPSNNIDEVKLQVSETEDAYLLSARFGSPNFGRAENINNAAARAAAGGVLSMHELLCVAELYRVVRSVKEWRSGNAGFECKYIDVFFNALTPNKFLEERIFSAIKSDDEMYDNASPELFNIRRKIKSAENGIRQRLERVVRSRDSQKFLQDTIITQRDGRYVVPVKSEHRAEIGGLVHDTSSSGATLFVEPMAVVELNNEIKVLHANEKDEIERILFEFSSDFAGFAETAKLSFEALVRINLVFAKASLAFDMKATVPLINNQGRIVLKNARHPLLDRKTVVPISLTLGEEFDTLVITGPNTGGKTVTLKTIGLLTLMTMCGLFIPASDQSEICVFDKVLVDIGDEQSIEQSLSTFSSHMKNIINIIHFARENTLVLIDELGSGTDPVEGAALATSILMELRSKNTTIAATTHYAELKSFAIEQSGVCNASCEFDMETLKPTYKLLIGMPGRSNAFAISEKLGLSKDVVNRAKEMVSDTDHRFESIVSALESEHRKAETAHSKAEEMRVKLEILSRSREKQQQDIAREQERIIEKAKDTASSLIDRARAESNKMLCELEDLKKSFSKETAAENLRRATAVARSGIRNLQDISDPVNEQMSDNYVLPRALKIGDVVLISDIGKRATVVELGNDSVLVLTGIVKTRVSIGKLRLVCEEITIKKSKENQNVGKITGVKSRAQRSAATEVDLRGMASDEAIMELDRYIDNAVMSGIDFVTVIHGKGTGVLRKTVQSYLRGHASVRTFRLGVFGEGESGVTVVELK